MAPSVQTGPLRQRWSDLLGETLAREEKRLKDVFIERPPHKRFEYEDLPEYQGIHSNARRRFDALDRAYKIQYKNGVRLGYLQVRLMKVIITSTVRRIFGSDLVDNLAYLRERYGITEVYVTAVIKYPRRSGKTTTQTIATAGIVVSQADGNIGSFHITSRQGRMWLEQAKGYLDVYKETEFSYKIVKEDSRELFSIFAAYSGTVNTASAYPGSQGKDFKNLRGVGTKMFGLFVDEGYWIAEAGVPVMVPLVANGAFFVITSSVGAGGARAGLMAILDARLPDGTPAVKEVNYHVTCDECKTKGAAAGQCQHVQQRPQHFQGYFNQLRVKTLLGPFDGVYEKELQNQEDRPPTEPVWNVRAISHMVNPANDVEPIGQIPHAYTIIDPHGGGTSQGAIVTVVRVSIQNKLVHLVRRHIFSPLFLFIQHGRRGPRESAASEYPSPQDTVEKVVRESNDDGGVVFLLGQENVRDKNARMLFDGAHEEARRATHSTVVVKVVRPEELVHTVSGPHELTHARVEGEEKDHEAAQAQECARLPPGPGVEAMSIMLQELCRREETHPRVVE